MAENQIGESKTRRLVLQPERTLEENLAALPLEYLCADGLYWNSFDFCRKLDDANEKFFVYMHSNLKNFTKNPQMGPAAEPVRVDELARQVQAKNYERVIVRDSTSGELLRPHHKINSTFAGKIRCLDLRRKSCAYGTYARDEATKKTNT